MSNPTTDCYAKATQSKGEWTPWHEAQGSYIPQSVCDKHNAALAAEEKRANDSIEENVRLLNRLAAERDSREKTELACEQWIRQCEELQDQLAAAVESLKKYMVAIEEIYMANLTQRLAKIGGKP